ncbi:hypothetical protein RE428_31910 [Marinobacter nanhaiticus D15-8W]|uniref:Uncharacterized protein n=1 Tax=Marinobacter nanhaiticus D15-8W TaxID=626887 RepID=N6W330_9GAMM|nr:hypothetical protein [Marinobacter nanhaiticus]ENO16950.1 hypothetical protein J057_01725 [Marinobacter nanhaiticus D15-8W]BES72173.1 hypothetical protein RE428_31910 [Marinobacter nanhaiticus D15-8W]
MPGQQYATTPTYDRGVLPVSDGADVTAGASSSAVGPLNASTQAVRFSVSGANCRILFGGSGVTVTASTGYQFVDGLIDVIQVPGGATHFAIIREGATDANVNYVELG